MVGFCPSACFILMQNYWTNNSLLSHDKTVSSLLGLLINCFRFQNMFWENICSFWFWWKAKTKRCINNYVITCVKRLSSFACWSSAFNFRYDLENGRMPWKPKILNQKYVVQNSDPRLPFFENREKKLDSGKKTLIVSIFRLNLPFKM